MEGSTSAGVSRNRLTCLTLQEHDDDDLFGSSRKYRNLGNSEP
jgi:hypothetical protein